MINEIRKNCIEKPREEKIREIEYYIQEYFKKYNVGKNSLGQSTQGTQLSSSFWRNLSVESMKPLKKILEQKLKNKNLVDLGTGSDSSNIPWNLDIPINKYTSVDIDPATPNLETKDPNNPEKKIVVVSEIERMKKKGIEASIVKKDMLQFVTHLPDRSSNFFLSAIDSDVILEDKYWNYLCEEIYRATENNGIIIDGGMGHIKSYLDKNKFKIVFNDETPGGIKVFEKI